LTNVAETKLLKRKLGVFYTPEEVFDKYIMPKVEPLLWNYTWIDLYCGKGDLIIPLIKCVDEEKRSDFFKHHVKCFDIDENSLSIFRERLREIGIDEDVIRRNIIQRDTLISFPEFEHDFPLYHITNPPYLYKGFIPKTPKTRELLKYFTGEREPLQDLYQIALFNDVKKGIKRMIYIIPTNFLFGDANANYIREIVFRQYRLTNLYILEERIFPETGTNTCICFFERKERPSEEDQTVRAIKLSKGQERPRVYTLSKRFRWRAGAEFYDFVNRFRANNPLRFKYYLMKREVEANKGDYEITVLDVNSYKAVKVMVNQFLHDKIRGNILFLKTLDTGRFEGMAGLYECREVFDADGIMVSKNYTYRTHPIQIFFEEKLTIPEQRFIKEWFNYILKKLREEYDSDFMTTYRENTRYYTRKYLSLKQARLILETCPLNDITKEEKEHVLNLVNQGRKEELVKWIENYLSRISRERVKNDKGQFSLLEYIKG